MIDSLDQSYLLEELISIIDLESSRKEIFKIPEQHKKDLDISLKQLDQGHTIPHEQVMKKLRDGPAN